MYVYIPKSTSNIWNVHCVFIQAHSIWENKPHGWFSLGYNSEGLETATCKDGHAVRIKFIQMINIFVKVFNKCVTIVMHDYIKCVNLIGWNEVMWHYIKDIDN